MTPLEIVLDPARMHAVKNLKTLCTKCHKSPKESTGDEELMNGKELVGLLAFGLIVLGVILVAVGNIPGAGDMQGTGYGLIVVGVLLIAGLFAAVITSH